MIGYIKGNCLRPEVHMDDRTETMTINGFKFSYEVVQWALQCLREGMIFDVKIYSNNGESIVVEREQKGQR